MLIKSEMATLLVRPFGATSSRPADEIKADLIGDVAAEDQVVAALERENEALRSALAEAAEKARAEEGRAREEGRQAGLEAARRDDEHRCETLRTACSEALDDWRGRLADLDQLAPLIARTALAKIFGDDGDRTDLATRAIERQLAKLRREAILAIHVSAEDFADDSAFAALAAQVGTSEIAFVRDTALGVGECRIRLTLGQIDVGPATQWRTLSALLDEEGAPA
jgi:flagellar biosynthesis/type III secretory pathway protein FliH